MRALCVNPCRATIETQREVEAGENSKNACKAEGRINVLTSKTRQEPKVILQLHNACSHAIRTKVQVPIHPNGVLQCDYLQCVYKHSVLSIPDKDWMYDKCKQSVHLKNESLTSNDFKIKRQPLIHHDPKLHRVNRLLLAQVIKKGSRTERRLQSGVAAGEGNKNNDHIVVGLLSQHYPRPCQSTRFFSSCTQEAHLMSKCGSPLRALCSVSALL